MNFATKKKRPDTLEYSTEEWEKRVSITYSRRYFFRRGIPYVGSSFLKKEAKGPGGGGFNYRRACLNERRLWGQKPKGRSEKRIAATMKMRWGNQKQELEKGFPGWRENAKKDGMTILAGEPKEGITMLWGV